jgi:hypothetical protein
LEFIGPFESHAVVLNGHRVPLLSATPLSGGRVDLTLDDRFAIELTVQEAQTVVPFIAHSIAVAMGYSAFPDEPDQAPLQRQPIQRMSVMDLGD